MIASADLALLLGAIYGDGYITPVPRASTYRVAMCSGDKYPAWRAEIKRLFTVVFGRFNECQKRTTKTPFFEIYINVRNVHDVFGVSSKRSPDGSMVPPAWVNDSPEFRRQFLRGLVETDGCFTVRKDARYPGKRWGLFVFSQKDTVLSTWVKQQIESQGITATMRFGKKSGTWNVSVNHQSDVVRLGEWLDSFKWRQLLATGFRPPLREPRKVPRQTDAPCGLQPSVLRPSPMGDTDADMAWFAGLMDAEGCFHIRRHTSRPNNVIVTVTVGLVNRPAMDRVSQIVTGIIGSTPTMNVRAPKASERMSQREFYSITVSGKDKVRLLLGALAPLLRGKRLEAYLALEIANRSAHAAHYRATEADFEIQRLSSQIKKGDSEARSRAAEIAGRPAVPHEPSSAHRAWLAGMLDGDGSIVMLREARGKSEYFQTAVVFGAADRDALEDMRLVIGPSICTTVTTRPPVGEARPFHSFGILQAHVPDFLRSVRPYLIVKGVEADLACASYAPGADKRAIHGLLHRIKTADYLTATDASLLFLEMSQGAPS